MQALKRIHWKSSPRTAFGLHSLDQTAKEGDN